MDARQREPAALPIKAEGAPVGDERNRSPRPVQVFGRGARRTDEINFRNQRAAGVLCPEQDYLRDEVIEVRGTERAGKPHLRLVRIADAHQIDVAGTVYLSAGEE